MRTEHELLLLKTVDSPKISLLFLISTSVFSVSFTLSFNVRSQVDNILSILYLSLAIFPIALLSSVSASVLSCFGSPSTTTFIHVPSLPCIMLEFFHPPSLSCLSFMHRLHLDYVCHVALSPHSSAWPLSDTHQCFVSSSHVFFLFTLPSSSCSNNCCCLLSMAETCYHTDRVRGTDGQDDHTGLTQEIHRQKVVHGDRLEDEKLGRS